MENKQERKLVEVTFVSDQDVEREIISIEERNKTKSGKNQRKKPKNGNSSEQEEKREELDEQPFEDSDASEKPTELFDVGDVRGQEMFSFQTPKKKNALSKIADGTPQSGKKDLLQGKLSSTPNKKTNGTPLRRNVTPLGKLNSTPRGKLNGTPLSKKLKSLKSGEVVGTPRTSSYKITTAKTPYSLRRRLKSKIASSARHIASVSSESDFSGSESDYKPNDSETSCSSTEDEDGDDVGQEEVVQKAKSMPRRELKHNEMEYVLEAEGFFNTHKSVTSNHTLNRLRQPRLAEEELQQLLENMTLSHQEAIRSLSNEYSHYFEKWMFALREQYSVLLYGLGSKFHTLQQFRKTMLQDHLVLEVNGFFPSLTIKEVVESIADELLELPHRPAGLLECLEAIETEISSELYVIVHNLEGPMLRSDKSQEILSRLACMKNVHLIASIDHINAPLIWDHAKLSRYNFLWWDVTSFQPYKGETQFETSLLVQQSGKLALSSLSNVFHSLTTNARNIFIMMVRHQLEHHKDPVYQGMTFKDLYWSAREAMLVSSDIALRAQLTEFLDHRLVRQRRGHDGSELLQVPVDIAVLHRFIEQVEGGT